jgi:hypothetical protein
MQECFLLSTTKDLVPVASIDGTAFKVGPDTVTARLKRSFAAVAKRHCDAHPDRAI